MSQFTTKFFLESTRSKRGAIVDAVGNLGNWPFRRSVSYNVGINCDSIEAQDGVLRVLRHGRTIAVAELPPPLSLARRLRRAVSDLMHPRHKATRISTQSGPAWEDLLRQRRPK
jgi:hypothetical protein